MDDVSASSVVGGEMLLLNQPTKTWGKLGLLPGNEERLALCLEMNRATEIQNYIIT
jgi:hypothetical protein